MKVRKDVLKNLLFLFFLLIIIVVLLPALTFYNTHDVQAANITNVTVTTRVNVTNSAPSVSFVGVQPDPIDLNPGTYANVVCNASVFDANGWDDISTVAGYLYDDSVGNGATGDNNFRYINLSCQHNASQTCSQLNGQTNNASCICTFPVQYYANNGSWRCNVTVGDTFGINDSNLSALATMNTVLGIDTPLEIDFGNLSVTETSHPRRENITNFGNVPLNVTVRGFGGSEETVSTRNLSMVCPDPTSINISPSFERFSLSNETPFANMLNISNNSQTLNITIPVREDDNTHGNATNATFWRLQIPVGVAGVCNGTVIFGAVDGS